VHVTDVSVSLFTGYFVAFNCKFRGGRTKPARSSLVVTGADLVCFKGEDLQQFDMKIGEFEVSGSCCFILPTTTTRTTSTTTTTTTTTTLAPTTSTCTAQQTFIQTTLATIMHTSAPRPPFKLQAAGKAHKTPPQLISSSSLTRLKISGSGSGPFHYESGAPKTCREVLFTLAFGLLVSRFFGKLYRT
jgi:hypothetical protein